jgi:hypothetical protein
VFFFVWDGSRAIDNYSGQSYQPPQERAEERLLYLSTTFFTNTCAYAVMSNRVHVVLHVHVKQTQVWSDNGEVERWQCLHKGTLLTQMFV